MAGAVVVGYDGLLGAKAALEKAIDMAKRLEAELVIVYGYEVSKVAGEVSDLAAALRESGESLVAEAADQARAAGIEPRQEVREGDPAQALATMGTEVGAEMIVVGTRGERPLLGAILGSLCHKLLHLSTVPVLVVPI